MSRVWDSIFIYIVPHPGRPCWHSNPKRHAGNCSPRLNFRQFTGKTIQNIQQLERALREYAEQGYSVDIGEYAEGVNCVASCVCDSTKRPLAAIWVTALSVELPVSGLPLLAKDVVRTAAEIGRRLTQNSPDTSPYVGETLKQAHEFIEEHFTDEATIHDYINGLFMSESWFRSRFREAYGVSPMQYRHQLVYEKARQLLEHTHLSIKEIAFQLGFESQNYFSRAFKKQMGVSPAQYRSQNTQTS